MKAYTKAIIGAITGDKGAGKSLILARLIVRKLVAGETVWSNMKVETGKTILARRLSPGGVPFKFAKTEPLDWDLLYQLDESLAEGTVAIDEIGYFDGSRSSMDTRNRLINSCVRQVRHRNLDFWCTAKHFLRIDRYLREEVDVLVVCNDLAYSPWGRRLHLPGGCQVHALYFDLSGMITGKSTYPFIGKANTVDTRRAYKDVLIHGRPYHDCYDTREIVSLEEAFTGVSVRFKKRQYGNAHTDSDGLKEKILQGIGDFVKAGEYVVSGFGFWEHMKHKYDVEGSRNTLGKYMPPEVRKIRNNGFFYGFERLQPC